MGATLLPIPCTPPPSLSPSLPHRWCSLAAHCWHLQPAISDLCRAPQRGVPRARQQQPEHLQCVPQGQQAQQRAQQVRVGSLPRTRAQVVACAHAAATCLRCACPKCSCLTALASGQQACRGAVCACVCACLWVLCVCLCVVYVWLGVFGHGCRPD